MAPVSVYLFIVPDAATDAKDVIIRRVGTKETERRWIWMS